jgi:hypothetical protein
MTSARTCTHDEALRKARSSTAATQTPPSSLEENRAAATPAPAAETPAARVPVAAETVAGSRRAASAGEQLARMRLHEDVDQQREAAPRRLPSGGASPAPRTDVDRIIAGFRQGGTGNCVSVAAIKAGMAALGPDRLFKNVTRTAQGVQLTMHDGFKVSLTNAELAQAEKASKLYGKDPSLLAQANLAYAAMAKRAQIEGNDGLRNMSYARALQSLNDGKSFREGAKWLGLGQMKEKGKVKEKEKVKVKGKVRERARVKVKGRAKVKERARARARAKVKEKGKVRVIRKHPWLPTTRSTVWRTPMP